MENYEHLGTSELASMCHHRDAEIARLTEENAKLVGLCDAMDAERGEPIPAATEPTVERMIDELVGQRRTLHFNVLGPDSGYEVSVEVGDAQSVDPDWRAALREAWCQVREGEE